LAETVKRNSMRHKTLCLALSGVLFGLCSSVEAQQSQQTYTVGRLSAGSPSDSLNKASLDAFRGGLRDLGWLERRNISLEARWAGEKGESVNDLAAELVRLPVDVIVAVGSPVVEAAKKATAMIPIVMSASGADPVAAGFIDSLARPGKNITGLTLLSAELSSKRLELLKEVVSTSARVAVLRNPDFPAVAIQWKEMETAAKSMGVQLQSYEVRSRNEIETSFML
jgi:putative ABC transport system substrate-binding protein